MSDTIDSAAIPADAAGATPETAASRPTVFQRAASYLQGREALAGEITQRDATIVELRAQLAERHATICALNTELTELRAGRDQLQTAVSLLEGQRSTVASEVAALGFPASQLPASAAPQEHVFDQWLAAKAEAKSKLWNAHKAEIRAEARRRGKID